MNVQWVTKEFMLGDLLLQNGEVLRDARIRYQQRGEIGAAGTELVLLPTYYGGRCAGNRPLTEKGPLEDPRYTVIIPALFGSGESTSPSNAHPSQRGDQWPGVSLYDAVRAQHLMLGELAGDYQLALVAGWSMGGMQSLQWGCLYPERVQRVAAWCASARCHPLNQQFLAGVSSALKADPRYRRGEVPRAGLRAFARVYASWAYAAPFWRRQCWRELGFGSREALLSWWEQDHLQQDAHDLLAVMDTWYTGDISDNPVFAGNYAAALGAMRAPTLIMPASSDLYFVPDEIARDAAQMPGARYRLLTTDWGHCGGGPGRSADAMQQILGALEGLLHEAA
ncbi:homoserine O-acetyltransferase [Alcanivorax sp. S71-1-4]|uniref:alpha/beta fold hydrolase n=1 Tax=Alcanivorax sp. S71-1-4 TaxID=1177159 RepID=UPI0016B74165|nr:alpha/beta fold hydrolase [Alcanivorax sp. S71-1-4]KAF0806955.1 homoserine O-acetyltransferase [Alcanivorax sp. S71-1-4]